MSRTEPVVAGVPAVPPPASPIERLLPGLGWTIALGATAWLLGRAIPVVGGPVFAVALGVVARATRFPSQRADPGIAFASRWLLQVAVVLLGARISLGEVADVGTASLPVMLGTLAVALVAGGVVGRVLRIGGNLRILVTVGTGICGASAIAAVSGVIAATSAEIAYAVATIFLFNLVAVFAFPLIGHLLSLGQDAFGLWAGTAINDTSSVVAAAYAYGSEAGDAALVVKLTRTTLIVPIVLGLVAARALKTLGRSRGTQPRRLLPWFLVGFLVASGLNTAGAIGATAEDAAGGVALLLISVALAAVGLSTRVDELRRTGPRPLVLGGILSLAVAITSLVLQAATGKL